MNDHKATHARLRHKYPPPESLGCALPACCHCFVKEYEKTGYSVHLSKYATSLGTAHSTCLAASNQRPFQNLQVRPFPTPHRIVHLHLPVTFKVWLSSMYPWRNKELSYHCSKKKLINCTVTSRERAIPKRTERLDIFHPSSQHLYKQYQVFCCHAACWPIHYTWCFCEHCLH